VEHFVAVCSVI